VAIGSYLTPSEMVAPPPKKALFLNKSVSYGRGSPVHVVEALRVQRAATQQAYRGTSPIMKNVHPPRTLGIGLR
jgi:hypothetical protein